MLDTVDSYADLGGAIHLDPDAPCHAHPRCDGTGHTITADPDDSLPLACPVHRQHLRHRRTTRRSELNRPRLILVD